MNDDQLHRLLRDTPARPALPASFNREVWARIEAEEKPSVRIALIQIWTSLLDSLSRPAPAFATIAICMLLGGAFGLITHREPADARNGLAYAESINPLMRLGREVSQ